MFLRYLFEFLLQFEFDPGKVYAVGDNGAAVYSTNSGTSWQFVTTGLSNNLYSALYLQGANKVARVHWITKTGYMRF